MLLQVTSYELRSISVVSDKLKQI